MKRLILLVAVIMVAASFTGCRLFPRWRQGAYCDPCMATVETETCSPCIPCSPCNPCDPCGVPAMTTVPATTTYGPVTGP